jgi:hypothetical protein
METLMKFDKKTLLNELYCIEVTKSSQLYIGFGVLAQGWRPELWRGTWLMQRGGIVTSRCPNTHFVFLNTCLYLLNLASLTLGAVATCL